MTVDSHCVAELHPTAQELMEVVLINGVTSPSERKVCPQRWPSTPPAIDAKYQWLLLYLLQLPAGEGWGQHSTNPFPLLIFSHEDGRLQDPVQTKVLHRENFTATGIQSHRETGEGFQAPST